MWDGRPPFFTHQAHAAVVKVQNPLGGYAMLSMQANRVSGTSRVLQKLGGHLVALGFVVFAAVGVPKPAVGEGDGRPNIVLILAEDLGPDLGCYGVECVDTPNLNRLASEGILYRNAHTTSPVCSTSRSAMMTGMYQNAIGAHQHRTADKKPLPAPVTPFPVLLQQAGYFTALMKSNKLDLNFEHDPAALFPGKDWSEAGGRPFFAQITLANTHRPWHHYPNRPVDPAKVVVPPYYPDTPLTRRDIANGLEEVQRMDELVGEILDRLRQEGVLDKTLIIFLGDNGRCEVRGKQFLYQQGTHVPLIMRWPGTIPAGKVSDELVSAIDVTATITAAAGVGVPPWMQGRDLLDPRRDQREYLFTARDKMDDTHDAMRACQDGRFKYILNLMPERAYCQYNEYKERQYPILALLNVMHLEGRLSPEQDAFMQPTKPREELYDLRDDPYETRNLADDPRYADVLERMRKALAEWRQEIGDAGVSEEFRRGGWPADYPTKSLEAWREKLREWEALLLREGGGPIASQPRASAS
ncbi:MAG: sulfatase family protein [Thermogutta sp.]